jgi:hypothetical protein
MTAQRIALSGLVVMLFALGVGSAAAADCDAAALTIVRYYLEDREAGEHRRAQRYLSPEFGQRFRDAYDAAYLDYMGDPDVRWRESAIQSSSAAGGACTVTVSSRREAEGGSAAIAETYTLASTYLGWRIEAWRWQPAP